MILLIFLLENGVVLNFKKGSYESESSVHVGDTFVDGSLVGHVNESIIKNRENLAEEGAVIFTINYDSRLRKAISNMKNAPTTFIVSQRTSSIANADKIIVLSRSVQNYFMEKYGRETVFIPNGVNKPEIIKADEITRLYGLKKDDYILFLGRLVPEKGLKYLVEAFKKVDTTKKLVIAGGSSDTADFENELRELGSSDERIIFTGFVQGKLLEELYSNAYVYVLPSDLEGMPLSLLEAMSYGNCCLTSDISECADVIGQNGVTFKKGNVDELSKALEYLCTDEKMVGIFKKNAAEYILGKYNWDDVTEKTLALYGCTYKKEKTNENIVYK